jgi:hypothetical protein
LPLTNYISASRKEFLLQDNSTLSIRLATPTQCYYKLAMTCLRYLSFEEFALREFGYNLDRCWGEESINTRYGACPQIYLQYHLLLFAVVYWPDFLRLCAPSGPHWKELLQAYQYYAQSEIRLNFLSEFNPSRSNTLTYYSTPLQLAAYLGLQSLVRNRFDINGVEENYSDALHAAVYGDHEVVVRFFIDKGVNVNGKPWQDTYCDALLSAVNRGHEGIARLLIGAAAKTDNVFTAYNAALQGNLVAVR